jgi:hypothetical protein
MIKQYQKFELDNLKIEANFADDVKPCKVIRFTIEDKVAIISKHDLYALLMLYADDEEMSEAVKMTEKKVKMIRKAVKVTAKKDIKEGEDVVFVIEYPVDEWIYNKLEMDKIETVTREEAEKKLN